MNSRATTREALARLFAQEEPAPPSADANGTGDSRPRPNGVIEREYSQCGFHLDAKISSEHLVEAARIMFDLDYYLESITGVDWISDNELEVVYDFSRYDFDCCRVAIRVRIDRDNPHLPTITPIYTGANWHERETHDFFGIVFTGHPHLIPLLLPEDADFHPLLKDFSV